MEVRPNNQTFEFNGFTWRTVEREVWLAAPFDKRIGFVSGLDGPPYQYFVQADGDRTDAQAE